EFVKSFEIIIQSGAILAVIVLYSRKFLNLEIIKRLFVAFLPTGIIGFVLYKLIKGFFIGNTSLILWVLGIGGVVLIVFEKLIKFRSSVQPPPTRGENLSVNATLETLDYKTCFLIGIFQSLAVVPGVSRSAATIVGGMLLGLTRQMIVEFSFLLAVPTLIAATVLDVIKTPEIFSSGQTSFLAVGFVTAFITAIISIKWLLQVVRHHTFVSFGIYRIVVALLFVWVLF
ncbi:MAG: undecaprenyl-diphosphate phosphatase, partial [Patescibacteria group bacterium]